MMMTLLLLLCVRGVGGVRVVNTVTFVMVVISRGGGGCDVVIGGGGRWRGCVGSHKHVPRLLNFSHSVKIY